ncbi:MAG: hypothetical protein EAZ99_01505 [Alphaproteobacteria bacterium]|nr:hypothetical protein [Alphaproteobacteria bacterium]TAD92025.1 MAG: hypothetical protein EAZ99_01505 [Alphaproteobacteria bacterium]
MAEPDTSTETKTGGVPRRPATVVRVRARRPPGGWKAANDNHGGRRRVKLSWLVVLAAALAIGLLVALG